MHDPKGMGKLTQKSTNVWFDKMGGQDAERILVSNTSVVDNSGLWQASIHMLI
jgi:hypothetical protein